MRRCVPIALLFLAFTAIASTPSYWFSQLQVKPDAQQAQEFWFLPGTNMVFTYTNNHVYLNAGSGGGGNIQLTGDVTGGPGPSPLATTLKNTGTAGTYTKTTFNAQGLETSGASAILDSADFANQGTTITVLHGNVAGNPSWGQVSLATDVTGSLPNANLANSSVTYNGTTVALGASGTLVLDSANFVNQGTTTTLLHGNIAGNPSWGAVNLSTDVTGSLQTNSIVAGETNQVLTTKGVGSTAAWSGSATLTNLNLVPTISSTVGTISMNGTNIFSTYSGVAGGNLFIGARGYPAGNFALTGGNNLGFGRAALASLSSGSDNVAVGKLAAISLSSGNNNMAIGTQALNSLGTGSENTAVGVNACYSQTASYDVGIGASALFQCAGDANVGIGRNAGYSATTATISTWVGYNSGNNAAQKVDVQNSTALGQRSWTTANNQISLGNEAIVEVVTSGYVAATNGFFYQASVNGIAAATPRTPLHAWASLAGYGAGPFVSGTVTATTYYPITNYNRGVTNLWALYLTRTNGVMQNVLAGWYHISFSVSGYGGANDQIEVDVATNGVPTDFIAGHGSSGAGLAKDICVSGTGRIWLAAATKVSLMIQSSGTALTITHAQLDAGP